MSIGGGGGGFWSFLFDWRPQPNLFCVFLVNKCQCQVNKALILFVCDLLGYRQVLSEVDSLDEHGNLKRIDGRQLKQYRLSDYQWLTYGQVDSVTNNLAQGLMSMGITDSDKVLILSETRVEWMLSAQAIIRTGAAVVTLFSNLGLSNTPFPSFVQY